MLSLRKLHAYVGMLIAPTVLFLAATGILQVYSLHEAHRDYTPPALIAECERSSQGPALFAGSSWRTGRRRAPARRGTGFGRAARRCACESAHHPHIATALLKAFFAFVAIGLVFSTLAGIWMALQQSLRRRTHLVLLLLGTIVPVALAVLTA